MKKKETHEETPLEENVELETPQETDQEQEDQKDNVADLLTSKHLAEKVEKLIDEKMALAQEAQDNEEEEIEEENKESKGLGWFPLLLIAGVAVVGVATVVMKNRPISHPTEEETQNDG